MISLKKINQYINWINLNVRRLLLHMSNLLIGLMWRIRVKRKKFKEKKSNNALQKLDHIFTILGTVVSIVLASLALRLTIKYGESEQRIENLDKVVHELYVQTVQNDSIIAAIYDQVRISSSQVDSLGTLAKELSRQSIFLGENMRYSENFEKERSVNREEKSKLLLDLLRIELSRNNFTAQFILDKESSREPYSSTGFPITVYNELVLDEFTSQYNKVGDPDLLFDLVALKKLIISSNKRLEDLVYQRSLYLTAIPQQQNKVTILLNETMGALVVDAHNIQERIQSIIVKL